MIVTLPLCCRKKARNLSEPVFFSFGFGKDGVLGHGDEKNRFLATGGDFRLKQIAAGSPSNVSQSTFTHLDVGAQTLTGPSTPQIRDLSAFVLESSVGLTRSETSAIL